MTCRLLGISRQGFYQKENRHYQRVLQLQQVKQMVVDQRREMPRLGGKKVHFLIKELLQASHIKLGRDGLFDFLRSEHMLIKPRKNYTKQHGRRSTKKDKSCETRTVMGK